MWHSSGLGSVIAIVRSGFETPDWVLDALIEGGLTSVEITIGTPNALRTLDHWRSRAPGSVLVGAGTVTDAETAQRALGAGAQFVVTPNVDGDVLGLAADAAVPTICGALSPSEIVRASAFGATAVKIFPVSAVGGVEYVKQVSAPLSHISLVAVGGVGPADAADYLDAGCVAVGIGSALVPSTELTTGDFEMIRSRAKQIMQSVSLRS